MRPSDVFPGTLTLGALAPVVVAVLAAVLILVLRFARRGTARSWSAPSILAAALLPLAVGSGVGAVLLRRASAGLTIGGRGGVAALAAGALESLAPIFVGTLASIAVLVLAFLVTAIGSGRPPAVPAVTSEEDTSRSTALALGLLALDLVAGLGGACLVLYVAHRIGTAGDTTLSTAATLPWTLTVFVAHGTAGLLFLVSVLWILVAPRVKAPGLLTLAALALVLVAGVATLATSVLTVAVAEPLVGLALTGGAPADAETALPPPPSEAPTEPAEPPERE